MKQNKATKCCKRRRAVRYTLLMLGILLIAPLLPYAIAERLSPITVPNPGSELWRDVRTATQGTTQVKGVDTGVLINDSGEQWRHYRTNQLAPAGGIALLGMIVIFIMYYFIRGKIRIEEGRSDQLVRRYTNVEIGIHWVLAITFVLLALSGFILLYGRWVLIPILGSEGFSVTATACKILHNYLGLLFTAIVPIAFVAYLKDSLFNLKVDLNWFRRAGGYLGGGEPSAEKVNAGQKLWYWAAMLGGLILIVSGLVLDFPNFGQERTWMQVAHLTHTVAAVGVVMFFFVHLYLATIGVEGAFESMVDGHVDANWAKMHHDLWYEKVKDNTVDAASIRSQKAKGLMEAEKPS